MTELIVDAAEPIALIGGADLGPEHLNILQTLTQTFVAADSGADHLRRAGIIPKAVIGDFDSLSAAARTEFAPQLHHLLEQDTTDLEKALSCVSAPVLIGAGFLGGRLDHSFASFNALARSSRKRLILLSDTECCFLSPSTQWDIELPEGTPFAILPMTDVRATTNGLVWDMDDMALSPVGRVSSSNKTKAPIVTVRVTGAAIVTLPIGMLQAATAVVRAE
ncbi:MAG: thiamine diphosphokinase [Yoonia sp.]|uniref:thiamine diphosphokinase n=1 Tax=Yoonia sp. TaxID=2212373 RepID=UPI003267F92F